MICFMCFTFVASFLVQLHKNRRLFRSVWQNVGATRKELEGEYGRGDLVGMVSQTEH